MAELSLKKISAALVGVAAVAHLIFNYVHTNALLLLEDEICGFLMFMFILMGLVALFQATRLKDGEAIGKYVCALVCAATDFFGYKLVSIYSLALREQKSLVTPEPVKNALTMSYVLMAVFALAAVLLIIDGVRDQTKAKKHG